MDNSYEDYKALFKIIANSEIHKETINQIKNIMDSESKMYSSRVEKIEMVIKAAKDSLVD